MFLTDYRNLSGSAVEPLQGITRTESDTLKEQILEKTSSLRATNGMLGIGADELAKQVDGGYKEVFINYLNSAGVELEFVEDIIEEDNTDKFPGDGDRSAFITSVAAIGFSSAPPAVLSKLLDDDFLSEQVYIAQKTKHLSETTPYQVADDNQKVSQNIQGAQAYVRSVFRI